MENIDYCQETFPKWNKVNISKKLREFIKFYNDTPDLQDMIVEACSITFMNWVHSELVDLNSFAPQEGYND